MSAPSYRGFYGGLSVAFSLGASHKLQKGALIQRITALHVTIRHMKSISVSTQISALRRVLSGPHKGEAGIWFEKVVKVRINIRIPEEALHDLSFVGRNTPRGGSPQRRHNRNLNNVEARS